MASEVTRARIRWGVVVAVATGVALGGVLSERIEERRATRTEERASVRAQPEPGGPDCTDGVDCYCDKVADSGHAFYDPSLVHCEDFEAATLHENVNVGGGAPLYGPWYDSSGWPAGYRGRNGYWAQNYGNIVEECAWVIPDPVNPIVGESCVGSCWAKEWRADDLWQGNDQACIDIIRNGEFDDDVVTLTDPQVPGKHAGVFDGTQVLGYRIQEARTAAILGRIIFSSAQYNLGITAAVAYPINSESSGIWGSAWKHEEIAAWRDIRNDSWFMFHNQAPLREDDPFHLWFRPRPGLGVAECETARLAATIRLGSLSCVATGVNVRPDAAAYTRSSDWPFGTWGCVRAHVFNLNTSRMTHRVWFNETLIIDYDIDTDWMNNNQGYAHIKWNAFANASQGLPGDIPTTETTYRYTDNFHVTAGVPVSCSQIGF